MKSSSEEAKKRGTAVRALVESCCSSKIERRRLTKSLYAAMGYALRTQRVKTQKWLKGDYVVVAGFREWALKQKCMSPYRLRSAPTAPAPGGIRIGGSAETSFHPDNSTIEKVWARYQAETRLRAEAEGRYVLEWFKNNQLERENREALAEIARLNQIIHERINEPNRKRRESQKFRHQMFRR